ncbi:MAG: hypothetical protein GY851_06075, partial [bacterium]|nr:hypothetical protein [bacterium]
ADVGAYAAAELGGKVYFGGTGPYGIWTTDGTVENTELFMADMVFRDPVVSGTTLFFLTGETSTGPELWASNGTPGGTGLVQVFPEGYEWPSELCAGAGPLAFAARDTTWGEEPWLCDGTAGGTQAVKDINTASLGCDTSYSTGIKPHFAEVNGVGYFALQTDAGHWDAYGRELWRSDGTGPGTYMVEDINRGRDSSDPEGFIRSGDTLFFAADNGAQGQELWKSDGTEPGTWRITGLYTDGDAVSAVLGAVNDRAIFTGFNGSSYTVYRHNGIS